MLKGIRLNKFLCAVLLSVCVEAVANTTVWIVEKADQTDSVIVQMRAGPGKKHKPLKPLQIGTELFIVKGSAEKSGFTKVMAETGEVGWVETRYLTKTPNFTGQKTETQQANLQGVGSGTKPKTVEELTAENARLNSEIITIRQASANALQIQIERDKLTEDKRSLVSEVEMLKREKYAMDTNGKQNWFMIGAGVLLAGIALGVVLPRLSWRKKNNWETF